MDFKVGATLTEEEMTTLSEVLWPGGAIKADDPRQDSARSIWKKLIVVAELKYKREFNRLEPESGEVEESLVPEA